MIFKKEKESGPLTVLDRAGERLQKILDEKEKQNERTRTAIKQLNEKKAAIRAEYDSLASQVESQEREYSAILAQLKAAEAAAIAGESVTEKDLKAGKVSIGEFLKVGTQQKTIEAEALAAAAAKLEAPRKAIRSVRVRMFELVKAAAELDERIARETSDLAESLFLTIEAMKKELEEKGVHSFGLTTSHTRRQEADNNLAAVKGALFFHAISWQLQTIEEAERLPLDPRIQEKHFPELQAVLNEIRALSFAELTLNYVPCEWTGRAAGSFWHSFRLKVG